MDTERESEKIAGRESLAIISQEAKRDHIKLLKLPLAITHRLPKTLSGGSICFDQGHDPLLGLSRLTPLMNGKNEELKHVIRSWTLATNSDGEKAGLGAFITKS